jgi:hypothetical protein
MLTIETLGLILVGAVAIGGTTGARLKNTGEISARMGTPLFLVVIVQAIAAIAALGYFSWAYLGWVHLAAFFLIWFIVADPMASRGSRELVLGAYMLSAVVSALAEILILRL